MFGQDGLEMVWTCAAERRVACKEREGNGRASMNRNYA